MKKFHLVGFWRMNTGPQNVNRALIDNSDGSMDYAKHENKILRKIENIFKCIVYRTIVFSAYVPKIEFFIARLLRKRIIILAHGCLKMENEINKSGLSRERVTSEQKQFDAADLIVAVSKIHACRLCEVYPEIKNKIKYVNNGIDIAANFIEHENNQANDTYVIAVSGGNRYVKRNKSVCEAVQKLIHGGLNIHLESYGR